MHLLALGNKRDQRGNAHAPAHDFGGLTIPGMLKHSFAGSPTRVFRMKFPPDQGKPYCVRAGYPRSRQRLATGHLLRALVLIMVAVTLAVSAVSPADDATQPEFGRHKLSRLLAESSSRATYTYTRAAIFPALVADFCVSPQAIVAETVVVAGPLAALTGFAAIAGARSPPRL